VRVQFAAPVAADGDQRDVGLIAEQRREPTIDEVCVGPAERRASQSLIRE